MGKYLTLISELNIEEQELFNKGYGSIGSARQYTINYLETKKQGKYLINSELIKLELDDIKIY